MKHSRREAVPPGLSRLALWVIAPGCLWFFLGPSATGAADLTEVVNGGFEEWTDDAPQEWKLNTHPDLAGTWELSSDARSGERAVLLRPGERGKCHVYQWHFPVSRDVILRATAWVKGRGEAGLMLYTYDADKVFNGSWSGVQTAPGEQYQPLGFCYVPHRPDVGFVALVLTCSGEGAHAIVDDVAVERLVLEEMRQKWGYTAHLAAEMNAGRWAAPGDGSVELSDGPYDAPGVTCRFVPADDAAPAFDPRSWWSQSAGGGAVEAGWTEADGPKFPLYGGVPYQVRLRHRAQHGLSVHYKLRYFDEKGEEVPIGAGPCAYHQIGGVRDGSWPWRERVAMVSPPSPARQARIEVWARPGSGPVALADISVNPAAASTTDQGGSVSTQASDRILLDARPVELPEGEGREAVAFTLPEEARTRVVTATATALELELSTGISLRGAFEGDNFLGIGEVRLGDLLLHASEAPPWAPLLRGDPAADYVRCQLVAAEGEVPDHPEGLTLLLRLIGADGDADELEWRIWPHTARLVDLDAVGLGYSFAASSASRTLQGLTDRTVWGLAGRADGLTIHTQHTYAIENVFRMGEGGGSAGRGGLRFVHVDPLDFQTGPEGSLITYFDRPGFVRKTPAGARWGVSVVDQFHLPWGSRIETGCKYLVFTTARGPDAWTAARDHVFDLCRAAYHIRRQTPLPTVNVSRLQYSVQPESKTELRRIADQWVPALRKLGFRRIYLGPLWEGIVCGPDRLAIAEKFGGEAALKYLCDAAHQARMQVIAWLCPAHLWWQSSIFKAHPEYELRGPDGKPPTMYCWPTLRGVDLTTPHWDYFVQSVAGIRSRTGLDGLWLDSYCSFTHHIQTEDPQFPLRQGDALFRLHQALHRLGLVTYVEGCACYGIKSNGLPMDLDDPERPVFPDPADFYDTSPYTGPWHPEKEEATANFLGSGDHYYRYLANKCCVFIYYERMREVRGALERIAQANHDYNAAVQYMQRRVLLPEDHGVQWNYRGKPKVLFAFEDFELILPSLAAATDVTTGQRLTGLRGRLPAEKRHTYVLRTGVSQ